TRFFAQQFSKFLQQPAYVENRPGANPIIGVQTVINSPADGYTILTATNSPMAINPFVLKNLPYDPTPYKELKPIAGVNRGMQVILVPADSKMNKISELVSEAKARKQAFNLGTHSAGYKLAAVSFSQQSGI